MRRLALIALLLLVPAPAHAAEPPEQEEREDVWGRVESEKRKRAFPLDELPPAAAARALKQLEILGARRQPLAAVGGWEPIGPKPIKEGQVLGTGNAEMSGRIPAFAVDPKNKKHWLVGAAAGGIWQTTDEGKTWSTNTDKEKSLAIQAFAFAPSDPKMIYAGTGELYGFPGVGILRSTDGGGSWRLIAEGQFTDSTITAIKVLDYDPKYVWASTVSARTGAANGLFRSTDSGEHWAQELVGGVSDIAADYTGGLRMYAGVAYGPVADRAVYRWTGFNTGWEKVPFPFPAGAVPGRMALAVSQTRPDRVYVSVADFAPGHNTDLLGLWYTDKAWTSKVADVSWTKIDTSQTDVTEKINKVDTVVHGYCRKQCFYNHVLLVDRNDEDVLYAGGVDLWKCDGCTGGSPTWTALGKGSSSSLHADQHALTQTTEERGPLDLYRYDAQRTVCVTTEKIQPAGASYSTPVVSGPCDTAVYGTTTGDLTFTADAHVANAVYDFQPSTVPQSGNGILRLDTPATVTMTVTTTWTAPPTAAGELPTTYLNNLLDIQLFTVDKECHAQTFGQKELKPGESDTFTATATCSFNWMNTAGSYPAQGVYGVYGTAFLRIRSASGRTIRPFSYSIQPIYKLGRPTVTYVGNDGGLFTSTDAGSSFTAFNKELPITQFFSGAVHPRNSEDVIGGSQDNGTEERSGGEWKLGVGGDGGDVAYSNDGSQRAAVINGNQRITRSGNFLGVFLDIHNGLDTDNLPFEIRLAQCPTDENVFLTGTKVAYRNNTLFKDFFPAWSQNMPPADALANAVQAIGFAPSAGCSTYAVGSAGADNAVLPEIKLTDNGGTSWRTISNGALLPNRHVSELTFSATNPNVLWVSFQGYDHSSGRLGHLFRTDDALAAAPTWRDMTPTESGAAAYLAAGSKRIDQPINAIFLDPTSTGTIFLGTDFAVMRSDDGGDHWVPMGPDSGMPNVPVYDIKTSLTGSVVAFTHGRGALKLVKKSADLFIRKDCIGAAVVGEPISYLITVKNLGPDIATNVTVNDLLPPGVTFDGAHVTPPGSCTGTGPVVCRIPTLAAGDVFGISIDVKAATAGSAVNTASVTSDAVDPDTTSQGHENKATCETLIADPPSGVNLGITKSHSPDRVNVKKELTYTLTVTNRGPQDSTGSTVTDTLPSDVEFVSASNGCTGTTTVTCTIGPLAKGAQTSVTITVRTTRPGTLTNTATVTGKEPDPVPANNTATDTVQVLAADLEVEKTASPDPVQTGNALTFFLKVTNKGPDRASNVTLIDVLPPAEVTLRSATATQGGCSGFPTVTCALGEIASGVTVTVTIVVTPTRAGRLCNTGDVTAEEYDPNSGNNASTVCVEVKAPTTLKADRLVVKTHTPAVTPLDNRVTYTIRVTNNGPDDSHNTTVVDTLPPAISFVSAAASQGGCGGSQIQTCNLGTLAPGATATITLIATGIQAGLHSNVVTVTGDESDPNPGNDVFSDPTRVVALPAITKLTPSSAAQGTRNIDLKVEGVRFQPGAVLSFQPSTGIEVVPGPAPNFGFVSPVELHATIHIAGGAPLGEREAYVTNPDGGVGGQRPFDVFTVTTGAKPVIALSASNLDFGSVAAKTTRDRTFDVRNTGNATLRVAAIGASPPYGIASPSAPFDVPAGGQRTVTVRLAPQAAGTFNRTLVISSNDPAKPGATLALTGSATAPALLELSPAALNFGSVSVGQSRSLAMRIRNKGDATLTVTSLTPTGGFAASATLPLNLAPGAEQTVNVSYTPSGAGAQTGKLTLASNDVEQPSVDVQLRGEGAAAAGTQALATDDGSVELAFIADGLTMVNRFTPSTYPAQLKKVSLFVTGVQGQPSPAGKQVRLIAFSAGGSTPPASPLLLLDQLVTLPAPNGAYQDFDLPNGPTVISGDLYVGYVAPSPAAGVGFAADTNGPQQQRGWFSANGSTYSGPVVNSSTGAPANLMIRATVASGSAPSSCTWGIAPAKLAIPKEGGSGTIDVTAPAGCPWTVTSDQPFLSFSGAREPLAGGSGNGTVRYTVAPAPSDAPRSASISIAQLDSKVTQSVAAGSAAAFGRDVFVPIVLSTAGLNGSFFTSELTLTNRGTSSAVLQASYTQAFGGGGGSAFDVLAPGAQRIYPDGLAYLKSLGTPMPDGGNRGGTVSLSFSGLSSSSAATATVRTTTRVPEGRAGLAYGGVPAAAALTGPVYILGLRQTETDRSNLALMNAGTQGDVVLRVTVYSGETPLAATLSDIALPPGGFNQISGVLGSNGLSLENGYVKVERVGGTAPFFAYGVINDQANSDGSFVPPVSAASLSGKSGITVPVIVETSAFSSELVVTNFGTSRKTVRLALVTDSATASFGLDMPAGQQVILPSFVQYLRDLQVAGIGPAGGTTVGPLFVTVDGGDASGIFAGARTSSAGGGGRYGLFYTGVPNGLGASRSAWLYGLLQDGENRSNVALVNTGEVDGSGSVFRLDIYDGETGALVNSVDGVTLGARRWTQITTLLAVYASGVTNGYLKVTRTSGNNPFVAYAVVNDGGLPGQRSGDGAFVPMSDVDE